MQAVVKWVDGVMFLGESGSGHTVTWMAHRIRVADMGARPMEMFLLGLGGCASFDVISMLKKGPAASG